MTKFFKGEIFIIAISKDERAYVSKVCPHGHIVRLRKGDSQRHHYLMSEDPELVKALEEYRKNINTNYTER